MLWPPGTFSLPNPGLRNREGHPYVVKLVYPDGSGSSSNDPELIFVSLTTLSASRAGRTIPLRFAEGADRADAAGGVTSDVAVRADRWASEPMQLEATSATSSFTPQHKLWRQDFTDCE